MKLYPCLALAFAVLAPLRLWADPGDVAPAQPEIPARVFNLRDFGAVADGRTPATDAFRRAFTAVAQAGGGTLVVPAGNYFTGPIELCSRLNLHLEAGARLLFSQAVSDYRLETTTAATATAAAKQEVKYRPMVGAHEGHDIIISGAGALDGQGQPWWVLERKAKNEARANGLPDAEIGRPLMVNFDRCQRVRLEGVTLTNPPKFHFVPSRCEDVTVEGITIQSPANSPNTDGIDPSVSRRVLIAHCRIDTGDDCIAVKAGTKGFGSSEDILVTDCTFLHGHGCSIGSDTDSGVRRMTVRRCTFEGTEAGVRLKSRRGRGGMVEDITYTDLTMHNVGQAVVISSYYYGLPKLGQHDAAKPVAADTPIWRNILVRNVVATGGRTDAGLIIGLPEMPARAITLENVQISARRGLRIGYAEGVMLKGVTVTAEQGPNLLLDDTVKDLSR